MLRPGLIQCPVHGVEQTSPIGSAWARRGASWVLDGFPDEVDTGAKQIYVDFNKEHGTGYKLQLKT